MKIAADHLEALIAVADGKGFHKAAAALGISQASVTNKLRRLQNQLATPLFVVEGKKKVLTPFGKAVSETARRNLDRLETDLLEVKHLHASGLATPIRVGCRPEVFAHVAPNLPANARFQFVPLASSEVGAALLSSEIDVGFSPVIPDSHQILAKKAFTSRAHFVIHEKLLMKRGATPWKDPNLLREVPALAYGTDGHLLKDLCEKQELAISEINVRIVADSWTTLADLAAKALGYAVVPSYVDCGAEVARFPLPDTITPPFEFYCSIRAAYREVPVFKTLLRTSWSR